MYFEAKDLERLCCVDKRRNQPGERFSIDPKTFRVNFSGPEKRFSKRPKTSRFSGCFSGLLRELDGDWFKNLN